MIEVVILWFVWCIADIIVSDPNLGHECVVHHYCDSIKGHEGRHKLKGPSKVR